MRGEVFFDTSVLIYLLVLDDPRSVVAYDLVQRGGTVSVQVLNEFVSVSRRKLKLTWPEIDDALSNLHLLCGDPTPVLAETQQAAVAMAKRYGFHIYDSLIVASAIKAGAAVLYSEDMQHGQRIGALTIRNPFLKV